MKRFLAPLPLGLLLSLLPLAAYAHAETGHGGGFVAGFLHPVTGPDHVVAMVAFPLVMAYGGLLGLLGVPILGAEAAPVGRRCSCWRLCWRPHQQMRIWCRRGWAASRMAPRGWCSLPPI